jgi:hypothetical protein
VGQTAAWVIGSLAACVGASWWATHLFTSANGEPGAWATAAVVSAGFALSAIVFHSLRVRAALTLRRSPPDRDTVIAHLQEG